MLNREDAKGFLLQFIRFGIGEKTTYCMDMSSVGSIMRLDSLKPNPEDKEPAGWLLMNRESVPVFNIAKRLGQSMVGDPNTGRIVVLDAKPNPWGFIVDRVLGVIQAEEENVFPMPSALQSPSSDFYNGVIKLEDELILYFSPERLNPQKDSSSEERKKERRKQEFIRPKSVASRHNQTSTKERRILFFYTMDSRPNERPIVFGLSITQVLEILEPLSIIPVPVSAPFVLGLVNWRNRPVPVIDLNVRLGIGLHSFESISRLLIARTQSNGELIGFHIKPNVSVQSLPIPNQVCSRVLRVDKGFTRGVFELENETLVVPDIDMVAGTYESSSQ
ncbi:MAG: chemotaxis protein CheW [Thermodesulfobacteriota bacterium]